MINTKMQRNLISSDGCRLGSKPCGGAEGDRVTVGGLPPSAEALPPLCLPFVLLPLHRQDAPDKYEVREQIGKGAFGAAMLVINRDDKQECVLLLSAQESRPVSLNTPLPRRVLPPSFSPFSSFTLSLSGM
jgi:hypothetical protein